jgi:glycosyltransferase involved in cell wall biosynthesis
MPNKKPVFLIVIPSFTLGGTERQGLAFAMALRHKGNFEPVLLGLGRQGELVGVLQKAGLKYCHFDGNDFMNGNSRKRALALFALLRTLLKAKAHTVICFSIIPSIMVGAVWRLSTARAFICHQGSLDYNLPVSWWERWAMFCRPTYAANGPQPARFIRSRHRLAENQVKRLSNHLSIPKVVSSEQKAPEVLQVLMLSNFFPEKDHFTVLNAAKILLDKGLEMHFHFVGFAPGKSNRLNVVKALAYDLGLQGKVFFHGPTIEPERWLCTANVGLLSTLSEGFSNALMEYMAYGLPIVATRIQANVDVLGEENAPWLFEVGAAHELADRLLSLQLSPNLRTQLGGANRTKALLRFSNNHYMEEVDALLAS